MRLLVIGCLWCSVVPAFAQATQSNVDEVEQWTPASLLSRKMFDGATLAKRWVAAQMPGLEHPRIVHAAGVIRDRALKPTGQTRPPAEAVVANASGPRFDLDLGKLDISTYAIRVVGMVSTDQLDRWRRPLILELTIDDQHGGGKTVYRQRVPYWDDFYAVTELYFNADEARHYSATLRVADGSAVDFYVYSIELHDCLAGLARKATKRLPGTYSYAERSRVRAIAKPAEVQSALEKEVPLDAFLRGGPELTAKERRDRDDLLWNAVLPINTQYIAESDEDWLTVAMGPGELPARQATDRFGVWDIAPSPTSFVTAWRTRFALRDSKIDRTYTLDDLKAHRPLPDPYPYKDRGEGVYFPATGGMAHPQHWLPIARAVGWWWEGSRLPLAPYHGSNFDQRLPYLYFATDNKHAARDAAFMLARWAYLYPALTDDQMLGFSVVAPGLGIERDNRLRWRRFGYVRLTTLMVGLLYSYDQLFDYIDGNQELARAVGRYIPWIKTDVDLRRMIETRLVQYAAKQIMRWQRWDDKDTPTWLMIAAAIQQDPNVTRPWMKQLWDATWVYPYDVAGLPDLISTTTQRTGTTTIGSVYYTQAGTPFAELVDLSHRYVENGGDTRFDLQNLTLYGKLAAATMFPLDSTIGGGFPLTIGDVGAVDKPRQIEHVQDFASNWHHAWKWMHDPRAAWIIAHYLGRSDETDTEWKAITDAADSYRRNPFLAQRSRVLANWAGILESGQESDDYRFKRSAYLRVGTGYGHDHLDTLDLQIQAHGVRLAGDLGWRGEYSQPNAGFTLLHNRVVVDDAGASQGNWQGHAWIAELLDLAGARYMAAEAIPPAAHAGTTKRYRRSIALIDSVQGQSSGAPHSGLYRGGQTLHAKRVTEPESYVFDVQRITGGTNPTWCFHGPASDKFDVNMDARREVGPATSDKSAEATYLRKFLDGAGLKESGTVPANEPLVATWRLRRNEDMVVGVRPQDGVKITKLQRNAEKAMLGVDYDISGPAKFMRARLFGHAGDTVLVGYPTPIGPDYATSSWPFLFVRNQASIATDSVYTAIYEPYADHPFIAHARALQVQGASKGADEPVAVALSTTAGDRDWLFSDGSPNSARSVEGTTVEASFAYRSDDSHGLRVLELIDGTEYRDGNLDLKIDRAQEQATIEKIDYLHRMLWVRSATPPELWSGRQLQAGNAEHETSFEVIAARRDGACVVLTLDGPIDLSYAEVKAVVSDKSEVVANIGPVDLVDPGMDRGLTLTNDSMTRAWKVKHVVGRVPDRGYVYQLDGKLDEHALPVGSTLRVWELGVGDTVTRAGFVALRRSEGHPERFVVEASDGITIRSKDTARHVTTDQLAKSHGKLELELPGVAR